MWLDIHFIYLFFFCRCITLRFLKIVLSIKIGRPPPVRKDPRFQFLGCFRDKGRRALPRLILRVRGFHKGFRLVNRCGRIAMRKRYIVFSVQAHRECWSGRNAHRTYGRYGRRRGCSHWTGGGWANDVYRIKGGNDSNQRDKQSSCYNYTSDLQENELC